MLNFMTKLLKNQEEIIIQQGMEEELGRLRTGLKYFQTSFEQTNNNDILLASTTGRGIPKIEGGRGKALEELFQEQLPLEDKESRDNLLKVFKNLLNQSLMRMS